MNKKFKWWIAVLIIVSNQAFTQLTINRYTINNGGENSLGTTYKVTGSIGQVDANQQKSSESYSVTGGFWSRATNNDVIFKNSFEN